MITEKYFKIEQPCYEGLGFSGKSPLTLGEVRNTGNDETRIFPKNEGKLSVSFIKAWKEPPPLDEWLKVYRSEEEQAKYALMILKKHFDLNGLESRKPDLLLTLNGFGWDLYLNIDKLVREGEHETMLKNLLAELTDFCEAAAGEYFVRHLFEIFKNFLDFGPQRSLFIQLLPANALAKLDEIDKMKREEYEDYLERANQMGY